MAESESRATPEAPRAPKAPKAQSASGSPRREPLSAAQRCAWVGAGWLALVLAGPGFLSRDGSASLAVLGVALWAAGASRPGRRAFPVELLAALVAWSVICSWAAKVHWSSLLFIGPGMGLYFAITGALLRRLARRHGLALAAPAAWLAIESLRTLLEPPFGLSWMRLGVHAHAVPWLAGSARVWGVWGLSFVLAAAGGALADLIARPTPGAPRSWRTAAVAGLAPLALAAALTFGVPAPATEQGLRVMVVQPAIPQERKMQSRSSAELFRDGHVLTSDGLDEARKAGEPPPDLVAWGESMLPLYVVDPATRAALRAGSKAPPWVRGGYDEPLLDRLEEAEDDWVRGGLLLGAGRRPALLERGTAFASGIELLLPDGPPGPDGRIGRQGAVSLWSSDGKRVGTVGKLHLVPGAETMLGLERFEFVRKTIFELAGYVPDLVPHAGSRRLAFTTRAGRELVFGSSVCFDNAYDGSFLLPMEEGPVDFHLVASNEAWFRGDQEQDQMMAFTHLAAIATGRSVVRATNSGISAIVGPDGREVARLVVDGRDREVPGTLRGDVPLPTASGRSAATLYVRTWRLWPAVALALPLLLLLVQLAAARILRPAP